ncbi:hypothetical protein MUK42_20478 [Musa troglodytarum]|uniref:SMAD/FHA domain-containing protein n=1 Tax=Musa troglodytarum TaxID=320322 RepID=A0A9E7FV06_9LILI|nr:hypothetical protein MUK42_20478 [Musa troglodytarum]
MEVVSEEGDSVRIDWDSSTVIGRRLGLGLRRSSSADRTISRRHLSLRLAGYDREVGGSVDGGRVFFEVIGRNPVLVCSGGGGEKTRVYRNSEKGELRAGDRFSLCLTNPSFWVLKRRKEGEEAVDQRVLDAVERRTLERKAKVEARGSEGNDEAVGGELELELGALDVSQIDPIKEFGFLVKGHEFDHYPRQKMRSAKEWNWFLEEQGGNSDDDDKLTDEGSNPKRNKSGRKNKRGGDYEDEEWTGELEEEKDTVGIGNARRSRHSTRSKDPKRPRKDDLAGTKKPVKGKDVNPRKDEDDDEEDDTLGGFIVNDGDDDEAYEEESEEEEEFEDEEEDDDE